MIITNVRSYSLRKYCLEHISLNTSGLDLFFLDPFILTLDLFSLVPINSPCLFLYCFVKNRWSLKFIISEITSEISFNIYSCTFAIYTIGIRIYLICSLEKQTYLFTNLLIYYLYVIYNS